MPKKTEKIMRIVHQDLKGKIITENRYIIKSSSSEQNIIKTFCAITSVINLLSGQTPKECSCTSLQIITTDNY